MSSSSVGLLRSAEFRQLWLGDIGSRLGNQATAFLLPLLAVTLLQSSPFQVGLVSAAVSAPVVVLAVVAGRATRRLPALLVTCGLIRAACLALLGAAYVLTGLELAHLVVIALLVGSATVFYDIGYQTMVPRIIAPGSLVRATALLQTVLSVAELLGPAITGSLLQNTGPAVTVAGIVALFIFGAVNFRLLRSAGAVASAERYRQISVLDGLRFIVRTPVVRSMCVLAGLLNFHQQAFLTVFTIYLVRTAGATTSTVGAVIGAGCLGALVGALTIGQLSDRLHAGTTVAVGVVAGGSAMFIAALVGTGIGEHAAIAFAVGLLVNGFAQAACNVFLVSLRQVIPPPEFLSAVNAAHRLASFGPIPVGALVGGYLVGVVGSIHSLQLISASMFVTSLCLTRSPVCRFRTVAGARLCGGRGQISKKVGSIMSAGEDKDCQMTSVVIVDAYRIRCTDDFRNAGADVIRVQSTVDVPRCYAGPLDLSGFAKNVIHAGDVDATAAAIADSKPSAVVVGCEPGVELADALAEKLGCPGNGTLLSAARRDKYLMIEAVRRAGLAAARQTRVDTAVELANWHTALGGRVVVKPLRSTAGDSVFFCDTVDESVAAFDRINGSKNIYAVRNAGAVAQEYLSGAEYLVNTVSRDGCHRICEIWSTTRVSIDSRREMAHSYQLMPRTGPIQDELVAYTMGVLDALGIRHGPAHAEIRMTENGPVLIEIGARQCGDDLPYYVQLAQGESQLDWTVLAYLEPQRFLATYQEPRTPERFCGVVRLISPTAGTLAGYRGLAAVHGLESYYNAKFKVQPGDPIARTVDNPTSPGLVILMHESQEVLRRDADAIRRLDGPDFYDVEQA